MQLRYRMLMFKMSRLASQDRLTPVQEIGFATELAELVVKEDLAARVVQELFDDPHASIRRIGINAIRRTGRFDVPGLQAALLRRLLDPEPSIRHDAVWVIQEAKMDGGLLRAGLRRLAGSVQLPQDAVRAKSNPADTLLQAQVRARQVLDAMLKRDAEIALAALRATMAALAGVQKDPYGNGTVGQLNIARRQLQRKIAARALSSSSRLTFKRVDGPDGNPVFAAVAAARRQAAQDAS